MRRVCAFVAPSYSPSEAALFPSAGAIFPHLVRSDLAAHMLRAMGPVLVDALIFPAESKLLAEESSLTFIPAVDAG